MFSMKDILWPSVHLTGAFFLLVMSWTLFLLCLLLLLEAIAYLLPQPRFPQRRPPEPVSATIIIPAHNEATGLPQTLQPLLELTNSATSIELLVIADNCSDDTAAVAQAMGVRVLERRHEEQRGKGYAMDFGLRAIATHPPDVVVFLDADCQISAPEVYRLITTAIMTQRPTQAHYLMLLPPQANPKHRVAVFAFAFKNVVRMRGLLRLGGTIVLGGSGMAFPWQTLQNVDLASGAIVEDMKLGIDLAIAGTPALIESQALVTSSLPQQSQAVQTQRTRWEHGHLQSILTFVPQLLRESIVQRRFDLFLMGWDLCIPPLSLLVMLWVLAFGVTGLMQFWGLVPGAFRLVMSAGGMLLLAIAIGWQAVGKVDLPLFDLCKVPFYVLGKVPLYLRFLIKPQQSWQRTERDPLDVA
jgi:cellulose synthase/poly-beta-1,6-N-acetylglucosamine synthase-like glycosyltransferase